MDNRLSISVVVLTYNRKDCVVELLEDLQDVSKMIQEIILVDNASEDGTGDVVTSQFPEVVYLRNQTNLGACGRNLGMSSAKGDIVITLDDDILGLNSSDLSSIAGIFDGDPSIGAMNFRVVDYYTDQICNWVHHCPPSRALESFPTYELTEGAVAFRSSAIRQVGYYYEKFFIGYEGLDLAFRLLDAGFTVRYDGRFKVRHKHEAKSRLNWRFYFFDTRNQIWLAARRMGFRFAFRQLFIGLSAMAFYSLRDGFFWWWLKGIYGGVVGLPSVLGTRRPMQKHTEQLVREIDKDRPSFWSQAIKRLRQPANRLDG